MLRWESQLAGNDTDVRAAEVIALQNRFALTVELRYRAVRTAAAIVQMTGSAMRICRRLSGGRVARKRGVDLDLLFSARAHRNKEAGGEKRGNEPEHDGDENEPHVEREHTRAFCDGALRDMILKDARRRQHEQPADL